MKTSKFHCPDLLLKVKELIKSNPNIKIELTGKEEEYNHLGEDLTVYNLMIITADGIEDDITYWDEQEATEDMEQIEELYPDNITLS